MLTIKMRAQHRRLSAALPKAAIRECRDHKLRSTDVDSLISVLGDKSKLRYVFAGGRAIDLTRHPASVNPSRVEINRLF
jgi:hypothetical protein